MQPGDLGPKSTTLTQQGVEVPMQFRGGMPALDIKVNGQGPFFFAIDTGGMGSARADETLVKKLGLKPAGKIRAGDGSGNTRSMDVFHFDAIEFGGARFEGLRAPSRNYNRSPMLRKVSGILGIHLSQDGLLTIDYPNKKVEFRKGQLPPADGKTIFNTVRESPVPAIEHVLGGKKLTFHLDTGNMGGLSLPKKIADRIKFDGPLVQVGEARTVTSTFAIRQGTLSEKFVLGRHEFPNAVVTVMDAPLGPNIGSQVLRNFRLTFDQKNHRVEITRKRTDPIQTRPRASVGIAMANRNGELSIARVLPDSAAEAAGLRAGDKIVRLNGLPVADMQPDQMRAIMTAGGLIRFEVERDGKSVKVPVRPRAVR